MEREFEIQTPSLAYSTELLVMAPIKPGFVPTLDTVTYKSRAKILLKMLHAGRQSQHEYRLLRAMSDAVERVGVIRSLRVAVVEGARTEDDRILLSVHFDGAYEAYVRVIWQKAARLLDLIFCNARDYPTGWDHPFNEWDAWIRSVQVPTPFFYATPGLNYPDQNYLLMLERRDRGRPDDEIDRTRIAVPAAEEIAWTIITKLRDPTKRADLAPASTLLPVTEAYRQNLSALAGIYRLADWYRPDTDDGRVLLNAAHELLPQLADMHDPLNAELLGALNHAAGDQLAHQLAWFRRPIEQRLPAPAVRAGTPLPGKTAQPDPPDDVQAGILDAYDGVTHGLVCLLAFDDAPAAARFLDAFPTTKLSQSLSPDTPRANLALTLEGLRRCGLSEARLEAWPTEFRQGMAARAGLLGDLRWNHPRRWTLPRLNWPASLQDPARDDSADSAVALEAVHAIVQYRIGLTGAGTAADAQQAMRAAFEAAIDRLAGVRVLSVQWLARQFGPRQEVVDHFGYADGQSQPVFGPDGHRSLYDNQVHLGEALVGYTNAADRAEDLAVNADPELRALLRNGSFLAIRKLRQCVSAFRAAAHAAAAAQGCNELDIRARMMGRWPADAGPDAGKPLVPLSGGGPNDFDYSSDAAGDACPLGAHVRRANPRNVDARPDHFPTAPPGGRPPRLIRRGMSYGPPADEAGAPAADRGLMFMAYNASLAEQFEVVQGWLAGGNSTGGYSGTACPILGVAELGRERNFRFALGGRTVHMRSDGSDDLGVEPEPLVALQWGLYAFAPSASAQALLARIAGKPAPGDMLPWSAERGRQLIARLRGIEADAGAAAAAIAWKAALEDPESVARFDSASVWAAVRQLHGGVLRMPYGVLVAAPDLVAEVLSNEARYSASGYRKRLEDAGMGAIFLSRDAADPAYARLSAACNRAIEGIDFAAGFDAGHAAAAAVLEPLIRHAQEIAADAGDENWELSVDTTDIVVGTLATLCETWFGIDDGAPAPGQPALFVRGAFDWNWKPGEPVSYPGHFTAASRATFQPAPGAEVSAIAARNGPALQAALRRFIGARGPATITAPLAAPVIAALWAASPDEAVQTIAGAMMGFLPTTEGVLRRVLAEWTRDGTLLDLAARAGGRPLDFAVAQALLDAPLREAMKFRPVPEQIWRTAKVAHLLGPAGQQLAVGQGERLIVAQVSALHAQLEAGDTRDVFGVFGGRRSAGAAAPAPTHACPGYRAAMGVMLGLLAALLDAADARLGPAPAAGVLFFHGRVPGAPAPAQRCLPLTQTWRVPLGETADRQSLPGAGETLLALGDSWMSFPFALGPNGYDLRRALADLGYITDEFSLFSAAGRTLKTIDGMNPADGDTIYARLRKTTLPRPLAVLLDGGGNDFVDGMAPKPPCDGSAGLGSPLAAALRPKGSNPPVDRPALDAFLAQMMTLLANVIGRLADASRDAQGRQQVPIIVCAYDHPFPDGEKFPLRFCPWLAPTFTRAGFRKPTVRDPEDAAVQLMASFISGLNDAYGQVVDAQAKAGIDVQMCRLTGVLAATPEFQAGGHTAVWGNELHPNRIGYRALAQHLHDHALQALLARA